MSDIKPSTLVNSGSDSSSIFSSASSISAEHLSFMSAIFISTSCSSSSFEWEDAFSASISDSYFALFEILQFLGFPLSVELMFLIQSGEIQSSAL